MFRWSRCLHYNRELEDYSPGSRWWINIFVCLMWMQTMRQTWPGLHLLPHLHDGTLKVSVEWKYRCTTVSKDVGILFFQCVIYWVKIYNPLGEGLGNYYHIDFPWYVAIFPNIDTASFSEWILGLGIGSGLQIWHGIRILGGLTSSFCSSIHDLWLYKLRIICFLGILCFAISTDPCESGESVLAAHYGNYAFLCLRVKGHQLACALLSSPLQ